MFVKAVLYKRFKGPAYPFSQTADLVLGRYYEFQSEHVFVLFWWFFYFNLCVCVCSCVWVQVYTCHGVWRSKGFFGCWSLPSTSPETGSLAPAVHSRLSVPTRFWSVSPSTSSQELWDYILVTASSLTWILEMQTHVCLWSSLPTEISPQLWFSFLR